MSRILRIFFEHWRFSNKFPIDFSPATHCRNIDNSRVLSDAGKKGFLAKIEFHEGEKKSKQQSRIFQSIFKYCFNKTSIRRSIKEIHDVENWKAAINDEHPRHFHRGKIGSKLGRDESLIKGASANFGIQPVHVKATKHAPLFYRDIICVVQ